MESSRCGYKPGLTLEMAGLSSCFYGVHLYTVFHQQKVKRSQGVTHLSGQQPLFRYGRQMWSRGGGGEGAHELVLMYVHAFLLPSSPFSWLLLSGVLRLKPRTFSTVRNGSTPELHPKQSPLFPTFPSITMETTHKSYGFIGHLRGKPSIAITMQTRPVTEGKSLDGLPSLRSSPSVVRKPLYLCWPKKVLVGNSAH